MQSPPASVPFIMKKEGTHARRDFVCQMNIWTGRFFQFHSLKHHPDFRRRSWPSSVAFDHPLIDVLPVGFLSTNGISSSAREAKNLQSIFPLRHHQRSEFFGEQNLMHVRSEAADEKCSYPPAGYWSTITGHCSFETSGMGVKLGKALTKMWGMGGMAT